MNPYVQYYEGQVGGNRSSVSRVYVGAPHQRGHGIGSFLGGLFRRAMPYLIRGARTLGKEAMRAGINVVEDVENNVPLDVALRTRFKATGQTLKRKAQEEFKNEIGKIMRGGGYKISGIGSRDHSISGYRSTYVDAPATKRRKLSLRGNAYKTKRRKRGARRKSTVCLRKKKSTLKRKKKIISRRPWKKEKKASRSATGARKKNKNKDNDRRAALRGDIFGV